MKDMNQKQGSLQKSSKTFTLLTIGFALLLFVVIALFTILALVLSNTLFALIGMIFSVLLIIGYVVYLVLHDKKMKAQMFEGMIDTTKANMKKLTNQEGDMKLYPSDGTKEFEELNEDVRKVNHILENSIIQSSDLAYSKVALVYEDKERNLVDHHSFHTLLPQLINATQSYRNILCEVYYDLGDNDALSQEEQNRLLSLLKDGLSQYDHLLFSLDKKNTGVYIYIPIIDSINDIYSSMEFMIPSLSIIRQDLTGGPLTVSAHIAGVCYPYSQIDELFADMDYAKRMDKQINFYLPKRQATQASKVKISQMSMNLNVMSKVIGQMSSLDRSKGDIDSQKGTISELLRVLSSFLRIDQAGIFLFEEADGLYHNYLSVGVREDITLTHGKEIDNDFVKAVSEILDDDNSYYASERKHVSKALAPYFDKIGYEAGFYFAVKGDNGDIVALIFFGNQDHDMVLDSYLRESLLVFSSLLGDFILSSLRKRKLDEETRIARNVLALSQYELYKINPLNYQLTDFSQGIKNHGKDVSLGKCCYEAIYGLNSPCEKCPLKTSKKMRSVLSPYNCETSITLNDDSRSTEKLLLVKRLQSEEDLHDDPYDHDLLVNSYYSLILGLKNDYLIDGHGYLLLLKIDNFADLLDKYGSESLTVAMRGFANSLRKLEKVSNVYYYKPDTMALLLSNYGQVDAINECEAIYDLAQASFFDDNETLFEITFLPIAYPQGYPSAIDFLRHSTDVYNDGKYEPYRSFIYFDENGYSRSANKTEFMLSVINEKFAKHDFTVNMQPLLYTRTRHMFGAELLIRVSDDLRKIVFNTDALIKTAAANGKIGIITEALLSYIGDIYSQYGFTVFRMMGFSRLTINTDFSYLSDPNLATEIETLINTKHLPKGFLGFEITEKDIYDHYEALRPILAEVKALDVPLICDRYSGQYLPFERLKDLGINEFKIDRNDVRFIDTDKSKYTMVRSLLTEARENGLTVGLIGVENMDQFRMIAEINPDSYVQGYAFYKPLEKNALINAIRSNNATTRNNK